MLFLAYWLGRWFGKLAGSLLGSGNATAERQVHLIERDYQFQLREIEAERRRAEEAMLRAVTESRWQPW